MLTEPDQEPKCDSQRISVCIPVLNGSPYLKEAIESVLAQKHRPGELIICDNASTDDSVRIAASFGDPVMKIITHGDQVGMTKNWNRAIGHAKGEWIKVLPCDDRLTPGAIERESRILCAHPALALVASQRQIISRRGRPIFAIRRLGSGMQQSDRLRAMLLNSVRNPLGEPGGITFRKDAWTQLGGFDETMNFFCDMEFWFRLLGLGSAWILDRPSVQFRVHGRSMSFKQRQYISAEYMRFRSKHNSGWRPSPWTKFRLGVSIWARQTMVRALNCI